MNTVNILLAEDNRGDVLLVQEALTTYEVPYELRLVRDGGEALAYLNKMGRSADAPCPDLVLLDLNLPKVDGIVLLGEFRKNPLCTRTPVIIITSSDAPRDRKRTEQLGVARYFRKPSDLDEFMRLGLVVREVIANVPVAS